MFYFSSLPTLTISLSVEWISLQQIWIAANNNLGKLKKRQFIRKTFVFQKLNEYFLSAPAIFFKKNPRLVPFI